MHEMSLVTELVQLVDHDAYDRGIRKVSKIEVIVGDLSNVLPEALELAFFHVRKQGIRTMDESTELCIIREVAKAKCQSCYLEFTPDYRLAFCPKCAKPKCIIIAGETFRVESYEGSDEDEN